MTESQKTGNKNILSKTLRSSRFWIALVIVVVMQVADYFITNFSYPLLDSVDSIMIYDYLTKKGEAPDTDIYYVNVGFDKKLVPAKDEFGDDIGFIAITNRELLAEYLNLIKKSGYKYIFLDIRFEDGTESEDDSLLFATMSDLDGFSFSLHRDIGSIVPDSLLHKGTYSDYRGNFRDGFTRYELLQDNHESTPWRMYSVLEGKPKIEYNGIYYHDNGHLVYNMVFPSFYLNDTEHEGEKGREKYHYLSYELERDPEALKAEAQNKIIVIGDFENDKHQTYMGEVPGPLLSVRTYQALKKGVYRFSWVCFGITSVVYFLILYFLLVKYDLNYKICKLLRIKSRGLIFIMSLIGWGIFLSLVKLTLYAIYGIAFVAWLPALVFSCVSYFNEYSNIEIKDEKHSTSSLYNTPS
ncbi:MAG: CHASE2 domain-containing protein [Muribaculaceae bacterium]|nr:CHASE2 domain-containing protein [Muribaculaceae bacterium]